MSRHVDSIKTHNRFLLQAGYKPRTVNDYLRAVDLFIKWCDDNLIRNESCSTPELLDELLTDYFHDYYQLNNGKGKQNAANTIAGICMLMPRMKGKLLTASAAVNGWRALRPPESYPPITWELSCAVAVQMQRHGHTRWAVATLLTHDCFLRISELTSLRKEHIIDSSDSRFGSDYTGMTIVIPNAKGGKDQSVGVMNPQVIRLVRAVVHSTAAGGLLFPGGPSSFRRVFNDICSELNLSSDYSPHSLRHGGASMCYMRGMSVEDILIRGRWKSTQSLRTYIKTLKAKLAAMKAPASVAEAGSIIATDIMKWLSLARTH